MSDRDGRITTTEGTLMFREQMVVPNGGVVPEPGYDPLQVLSYTESPVHEQIRQAIGPALRRPAAVRLEGFVRAQTRARLDETHGLSRQLAENSPRSKPHIVQRTNGIVGHHRWSLRNHRLHHQAQMTADFFRATLMSSR